MSRPDATLYTVTVTDKDGVTRTLYGHVTSNVVTDYWQAYVDSDHDVTVSLYVPEDWP